MYDMSSWGRAPMPNPMSFDGMNTLPLGGGTGFSENTLASPGWDVAPVQGLPAMGPDNSWLGAAQGFLQGAVGTKEQPGWGGLALGGAGALMSGFMGMKQYGLAKQALAENKRQFQMNYDAQKTTTNSALQDRQRARVAANPGAYQSVGDYMNQNGIK